MDRSEALFERAKKMLPGGVNSPVRAYRAVGLTPRFITRADGAYIWDEDGNKYIDYVCSWGPMILGHNHPIIREAVERAVKDGLSFGRVHPPRGGDCGADGADGAEHRDGAHGQFRHGSGHVRAAAGARRHRAGQADEV